MSSRSWLIYFRTLCCRSNGSINYTARTIVRLYVSLENRAEWRATNLFLSANKKPNYYYCRELYTTGVMKLIPHRTHLMDADALTKSLPGPALSKHRDIMMGHMPFLARLLHCGSQPFYSRFLHSA